MKLAADNAAFIWQASADGSFRHDCPDLTQAQGLLMWKCPLCGNHAILVPFADRRVPPQFEPDLPRWTAAGSGLSDLTLNPSINLDVHKGQAHHPGECLWHGWVRNGEAA